MKKCKVCGASPVKQPTRMCQPCLIEHFERVSREQNEKWQNGFTMSSARRREMMGTVTELYRHYDKFGRLLYVGISVNTHKRTAHGHRMTAHWFDQIQIITIERFPNRLDAMHAEYKAIHDESPLYNIDKRAVL